MSEFSHQTVLLEEAVALLNPKSNGRYIDGTVGGAGHAKHLLSLSSPNSRLLALDRDPNAVRVAKKRLSSFGDRVLIQQAHFSSISTVAKKFNFQPVDGILVDLGVSSPQIDTPERGFSYRTNAPLDMRMDEKGETAEELIGRVDEKTLVRIFREGEVRGAHRLARALKNDHSLGLINSTKDFASLCERVLRKQTRKGTNAATLPFQALRIAVNDELGELRRFLKTAKNLLRVNGVLAVISFHSLEDRIVKKAFLEWSIGPKLPREVQAYASYSPTFERIGKLIRPTEKEIAHNPRSRSAKLRAIRRIKEEKEENA